LLNVFSVNYKKELIMAALLIQHHVKNYAVWRKGFDANKALRTSGGELSAQVFQDAKDPNQLTVFSNWSSVADAQKFAGSPELKQAMQNAGVDGAPSVSFLNEAEA
jgi:quinol monooxygenase YgiN